MKVNVLGTEYTIIKNAKESEYPILKNADGYCDFSVKKIVISEMEKDEDSWESLEAYENKVIRHELVHAYLYESGLDNNSGWARDETIIDWIAIQLPKLASLFEELKV